MLNKHVISECFGSEIINADLETILAAMEELTVVEFRMWVETCKTYANTHWSHVRGMEANFRKTGKWELPEVDLSESDESANDGFQKPCPTMF